MLSEKRQPDPLPDSSGASGRQPGRSGSDYASEGPPYGSDSFPSPTATRFPPTDGILDGRFGASAPWLAVVAPYVLEGLPVGIYVTDTEGVLVYANRAALTLLGAQTIKEIGGRTLASFRMGHTGGSILPYGVVELAGRDAATRVVDHQHVPLGSATLAAELTCGVLRQVADSWERADLEARRLMELGGLTRRVAHDLNNVLVAVLGYAHLLVEDAGESAASEAHQILHAAQGARELTGQILGYVGRPEHGFTDVDLSTLVDQTARLFEISVPNRVKVRYELGQQLPAVRAEPTRLRQVVMNLIINAAEAVGNGDGEITIRTDSVTDAPLPVPFAREAERLPSKEYGLVEVRDNGPGMDQTTIERAFEPFFTSKPEGRGLGLATVAEIMAEHYGAIVVDTAVGRGTAFRAFFPLAPRSGRRSPAETRTPVADAAAPTRRHSAGAIVLVVDEEELVRGMVVTALERAGFSVLEAHDARDAVRKLSNHPATIDLILVDLPLDDVNGLAVVRAAHEVCPRAKILYCAADREDLPADPGSVGLNAVLPKPYAPAVLVAQIDELLAQDR